MRIAILSRSKNIHSTQRIEEEIKRRGHEAIILDYSKCSCVIEKHKTMLFLGDQPIEGIDAIVPRIGATYTAYGAAIIRQFETMHVFTTLRSIALVRSRDKLRSLQILAKEGIDIPKTAYACHPSDVDNLMTQVGNVPLVIKVLEGTQGLGVMLGETHQAARSIIQGFQSVKADIIVQKFIAEAKGADIRAFVIGDNVIGAIKRQGKDGEFRSNLHRGGTGKPIVLTDEEHALAVRSTTALGLSIAGVDILQSADGPKIIEVNSSPGLEGIEKTTKINIAEKIIEYIESHVLQNQTDLVGA